MAVAFETSGFINYVALAYQKHFGVIINPTDIWYMVICEIAAAVKITPEAYETLFTTTPGQKQDVIVLTGSPEDINPYAVVSELKKKVPTDVDTFIPNFSTDSIVSNMSMHIAFCDMVSPFYNYMTLMCGIPSVTIGGTDDDWATLLQNLSKIRSLFGMKLNNYLNNVTKTVTDMILAAKSDNGDHFQRMIRMEICGSGSDQEINGWILNFINHPDRTRRPGSSIMQKNVHMHSSKMEYKNLDTERTFELYSGIYYSTSKEQILFPCYNSYRIETTGEQNKQEEKKAKYTFFEGPPVESKVRTDRMIATAKPVAKNQTCNVCGADMTPFSSRKWKHALCPSCAFITVSNLETL